MTFDVPTDAAFRVPEACTLPTVERPLRLAAFDDLFAAAVLAVHRIDPVRLSLDLDPTPAVAARVAELTAREVACCSFFAFTLVIGAGTLSLQVATPPAYADILDALATRADARARSRG